LKKDKVLVVGLGETGLPLYELLKECGKFRVYGFDIDSAKMREIGQELSELPSKVDVMHVCIPYSTQKEFEATIAKYLERFNPVLVIINSTVPPGTTVQVQGLCRDCLVAHSPIRGVHKSHEYMKWELKRWTKYVGGVDMKATNAALEHFSNMNLRVRALRSCAETELAKLFETTYRAWMITCFQEMHRISRNFGADFDNVVDFLEDTHRVRLDRPIVFPGIIGGHCLIPNVEMLLDSYDSAFLKLVLKSNEKRQREIRDKKIRDEAEKVKNKAEALQKELMEKWRKCNETGTSLN